MNKSQMASKIYEHFKQDEKRPKSFSIQSELQFLEEHVNSKSHELGYLIYAFKTLPLNRKTIQIAMNLLKMKNCHTYSLFRIKLISILNKHEKYIPLSKFLIELLILAIESKESYGQIDEDSDECKENKIKKSKKKSKKNDLNDIYESEISLKGKLKIGSNKTSNHFYNNYVMKKASKILFEHLNNFSNNIGFPELVVFIINKIENYSQLNELRNKIVKQKEYVENERKRLGCLNGKSFSKSVKKMEE